MKKLISMFSTLLITGALAATVFAAGSVSGKVVKVEGDKITVSLEGAVPAWAKKGASVSAFGGAPKVLSVNGKVITLKMSKEKAAKIKVDEKVTMNKCDAELQGC